MTRTAVRATVQAYIQGANLPFVGTVYPSRAYIQEQDYEQNANLYYTESINGSGCVVVVNLPDDDRQQKGWVGRGNVDDTNVHPVVLELFFASTLGDPVVAQQDYDTIVDALFILIRANPLLGDPQVIWSAGEFGGVKHVQSEPYTDPEGTTVHINGVVRLQVYEWIKGPAGT
jgi:hypothetical protein